MYFARPDANWWLFSIQSERRGEKIKDNPAAGTVEVNPEAGGKKLLSYHEYLRLDRLLGSQFPSSQAPEERIFILTHQLFELVFKQMIFDLRVIAETFQSLIQLDREGFYRLSEIGGGADKAQIEDFWRPTYTAASRVGHSCRRVMPAIMAYLATEDNFSNQEFARNFRDNLSPASGFQSAQFRLIQRALGKSHLFDIRLFPADAYLKNYLGLSEAEVMRLKLDSENAGLLSVTDSLILQEDAAIATPSPGSPLFAVAGLDDLAHKVLEEIAALEKPGKHTEQADCDLPRLPQDESSLESMGVTFNQGLQAVLEKIKQRNRQPAGLTNADWQLIEKMGEVFRQDWATAVVRENRRREACAKACPGAGLLLKQAPESYLAKILAALVDADNALDRFLLFHQQVVERRVGEVPGTAGGGVPFLDFSRTLADSFPALIALRAAVKSLQD